MATARIFVSSTFRDFNGERNVLVRQVFPQLRERLPPGVSLCEVDLRWGLSEQDAREGRIIQLCLLEIDRCRPFFLGMLGARYGYVPPDLKAMLPPGPQFESLQEYEGWSVTALEFLYGPLRESPKMALVLRRDPAALDSVPAEHRSIFVDEEASERIVLLEKMLRESECTIETYTAEFNAAAEVPQMGSLDKFAEAVAADLYARIEAHFPDAFSDTPLDEFEQEARFHDNAAAVHAESFVGRTALLAELQEYVDKTAPASGARTGTAYNGPLIVYGLPGSGKSALVGTFANRLQASLGPDADAIVMTHFVGVSPSSTDLRLLLRRICHTLQEKLPPLPDAPAKDDDDAGEGGSASPDAALHVLPETVKELQTLMPRLLERVGKRVVLILDALNQLDPVHNAHSMEWLPVTLPGRVAIVCSMLAGACHQALHQWRKDIKEVTVDALETEERQQIVREVLFSHGKSLVDNQLDELLKKTDAGRPLYLRVCCEELRVSADFEGLWQFICDLPDEVVPLLNQVMTRLETDHGAELVLICVTSLTAARHGLLEAEILDLLRTHIARDLPPARWFALYSSLRAYLRPRGQTGEALLDWFHRQFAKAVRARYLSSDEIKERTHRRLASMFFRRLQPSESQSTKNLFDDLAPVTAQSAARNPRSVRDVVYHAAHARELKLVVSLLCNLGFIEAKCRLFGAFELLDDYNTALRFSGDDAEVTRVLEHWYIFVQESAHILTETPSMVLMQAANNIDPPDAVSDGYATPSGEAMRIWESQPEKCRPWLHLINKSWVSNPCRMTLDAHSKAVDKVAFNHNGQLLASAAWDRTVRICDPRTGATVHTLVGHTAEATAVGFSHSVDEATAMVASGGEDGQVRLWSLQTGIQLLEFRGHMPGVRVCVFAPGDPVDGRVRLLTGGTDQTLRMWRVPLPGTEGAQELEFALTGHGDVINEAVFSPDGATILSVSGDGSARLWSSQDGGEPQRVVAAHSRTAMCCTFSNDGAIFVTGGGGKENLCAWETSSGKLLSTLRGHGTEWVRACRFSPADPLLVSGGEDKAILVWASDGKGNFDCLRTLIGHAGWISGLAINQDGRVASASHDHRVKLWSPTSKVAPRAVSQNTTDGDPTRSMCVAPNGAFFATGHDSGRIVTHSIPVGQALSETTEAFAQGVYSIQIYPAGSRGFLMMACSWDNLVGLWSVDSKGMINNRKVKLMDDHSAYVWNMVLSADQQRTTSCSRDRTLIVWDSKTGKVKHTLEGHQNGIRSVDVSPCGQFVVSGSHDRTARIWDTASGEQMRVLTGHTARVVVVKWSPTGRCVATGSRDMHVRLWDPVSGECQHVLKGHTYSITGGSRGMAFSDDGQRLAVASRDARVSLWDPIKGEQVWMLDAHRDFVYSVEITPDRRWVVSTSKDMTLRVFDAESGAEQARFVVTAQLNLVTSDFPSGLLVASDDLGRMHILEPKGIEFGRPSATAVRMYRFDKSRNDKKLTVQSPFCRRQRMPIKEEQLGTVVRCSHSGREFFVCQEPALVPDEGGEGKRCVVS